MSFNNTTIYNFSLIDQLALDLTSRLWLKLQIPVYCVWIVDLGLNLLVTIFLLESFKKWKIYDNEVLFFMENFLLTEILLQIAHISTATYHIFNGYFGISEAMSPIKCYALSAFNSMIARIGGWMFLWISIDRYRAIVHPLEYDNRLYWLA